MLVPIVLAMAGACATVVSDPRPPANVRSSPSGPVTTTLRNGTTLSVEADRHGWLHVNGPVEGWIHMSVTSVRCGTGDMMADIIPRIRALGARARTSASDADTLVRYALAGDGGPGEEASGQVSDLMRENPALLISVLDQFTDAQRRDLLHTTIGMNSDAAAVRAFERAVDDEPSHPTSATWKSMPANWKSL